MKVIFIILTILTLFSPTVALGEDTNYDYNLPDSVKNISNIDQLRAFLASDNISNRIAATVRLGEMKELQALPLLTSAIEDEPINCTSNPRKGVKYYGLISISRIGGNEAIEYIKQVVLEYGTHLRPASLICLDSVQTLNCAINLLGDIRSDSVKFFMDSLFSNSGIYWEARQEAFKYIVLYNMASMKFQNSQDSIYFLINGLNQFPNGNHLINGDKSINLDFLKRQAYRDLMFDFRETSLPMLIKYLNDRPTGEGSASYLDSLRMTLQVLKSRK